FPARTRVPRAPYQLLAAEFLVDGFKEWPGVPIRKAFERNFVRLGCADPDLRKLFQAEHLAEIGPGIGASKVGFAKVIDDDLDAGETSRHVFEHRHLVWKDVEVEHGAEPLRFAQQRTTRLRVGP